MFANTGVRVDNVEDVLSVADGCIVGTHFKVRRRHLEPGRRRPGQAVHGRRGGSALTMACLLGIDIGTTSTIGILVRTSGETLAVATRPVTLSSPRQGWAEENPEDWWANVRALVPDLLGQARDRGRRDRRHRRHRHAGRRWSCYDSEGRLLRPSIQQSDGRCGRRGGGAAGRGRRGRLRPEGRQRHQPAAGHRQAALDRPARAGRVRPHRDRLRILRLHQLAADRATGGRAELGTGGPASRTSRNARWPTT